MTVSYEYPDSMFDKIKGDYDVNKEYDAYKDEDVEYEHFIYPGYPFERTMYIYIWGILVLVALLANIVVICVLFRGKMRRSSPINLVLAGIAFSDSMTLLITLPAYGAVYSTFEPSVDYSDYEVTTAGFKNSSEEFNKSNYTQYTSSQESYPLKLSLCNYFMITKFFLSKFFHTISIWLTLFLGFHRLISVAVPFRANDILTERNTILICFVICISAPMLHAYHLVDEKAVESSGMCQWEINDNCQGGDCIHLVVTFLLRHFLPCVLLTVFTILFVINLKESASRISRIGSNQGNPTMRHRDRVNRRHSITVIAIVIVFLLSEVPYGCFLLYVLVIQFTDNTSDLEKNRAIHLAYEVGIVLSCYLNFFIYIFIYKHFRRYLMKRVVYLLSLCGCCKTACISRTSRSSFSSRRETITRSETINMTECRETCKGSSLDRNMKNDNGHTTSDERLGTMEQETLM